MANVTLRQLTKSYADTMAGAPAVAAVQGVDLEIRDGEFMVLVGPSGCGKSTTLRMIAGLEAISGGEIAIDGRVVNDVLPKDRDIAMVFQNYALYPHMTVFDNMAFGLKLRKLPRAEIETRVREAAALLGLEPYLARKPKALSGGQRQRVAVGRAIVRKPKVFLFDEPLSNLDAKMRVAMRAEIARLHERLKATIVYVTHDQVEAMTMGDRICVMKEGRILQVAEPLELYNRPANLFVAGFIGSPPMNFFRGRVREQDGATDFILGDGEAVRLGEQLSRVARRAGGADLVLGVRPEDVAVDAGRSALAAVVELAEPMGAETFLYLKKGDTPFVARVAPTARYATGQPVRIGLDLTRAHLFDAQSEQVLRML